jgi:hypothetical protein
MRATLLLIAAFVFSLNPTAVRADVVVSSSLDLSQLQIVPTEGTVEFLSPWTAQVFVQAQDSLGGLDQHFNSVNDSATSASASTALANASGAASFQSLGASAASGVNIPDISANASSSSNGSFPGSLSGTFEIVGATGPVTVVFKAPLMVNQFLSANGAGISASSEVIFNLLSPDINGGSPLLFFDNPLSIGPNDSISFAASPMLTDSVTLQPNTPYFLIAEVDAESSGLSAVPEPSFLLLIALGLSVLLAAHTAGRSRKLPELMN